jgi:hypothetical protein
LEQTPYSSNFIHIDSELSSKKITSRITVPKKLEKYFEKYNFISVYDTKIADNNSINNIPALSIILPLAWVTGTDVYVDELDETYMHSMSRVQEEYKKIYPKAPFKTKLYVKHPVKNKAISDKIALLFSGGVDSTHSLYTNIKKKPRLITIFGVPDIPLSNIPFQEHFKRHYTAFAEKEGVKINFIMTNALSILNGDRVNHLWFKFKGKNEGTFWNGIGFSLGQTSLAAPISSGRFSELMITAAKAFSVIEHPEASSVETDEKISWGDVKVKHTGPETKLEKIRALTDILEDKRITLRVCWLDAKPVDGQIQSLNCNVCLKCLLTIFNLVIANVSPENFGLKIDELTFKLLRELFEKKMLTYQHLELWWKPLQQATPKNLENDIHGSKKFYEWFRDIDLEKYGKPYQTTISKIYYSLPYSLSKIIWKVGNLCAPKLVNKLLLHSL